MRIIDLTSENTRAVEQVARLLINGFRDTGSSDWTNLEDALSEVRESLHPGRISRVAVDEAGNVLFSLPLKFLRRKEQAKVCTLNSI